MAKAASVSYPPDPSKDIISYDEFKEIGNTILRMLERRNYDQAHKLLEELNIELKKRIDWLEARDSNKKVASKS